MQYHLLKSVCKFFTDRSVNGPFHSLIKLQNITNIYSTYVKKRLNFTPKHVKFSQDLVLRFLKKKKKVFPIKSQRSPFYLAHN